MRNSFEDIDEEMNEPMNIDCLLSLSEVGRIIGGFSEKTIRRMIALGELPLPVKVRRRSMLPASTVTAFIEQAKRSNRR